jgi:ribosomal protein L31
MKKNTHPSLNQTVIQLKDGALYMKRWLFFRPSLSLEVDVTLHPIWRGLKAKKELKRITPSVTNLTK